MKAGGVFIGYDFCFAFDAHDILRCYNCNGFNHSSKFCNQKKSCPKCGVEDKLDHTISECESLTIKCINCIKLNRDENANFDTEHAAWDFRCTCYQRELEKIKDYFQLKK
jgi:hypothetical protein